jgi:4-hydroxy-4-methyl-2-oxoglutarate aldolase
MSDLAAQLRRFGAAAVSDALRSLGKPFRSADAGIRPVDLSMSLAGPAFTVRCYPGATWALEEALERASPGDVLAVDGGAAHDVILMGGLMSRRAKVRGIAGAVLDAAVRDVDDIIEMGFPVFSRYVCPRAGTFDKIGEWQTTVCIGRVPVNPGDWVVADGSGVAFVPPDLLDAVFAKAQQIIAREAAIRSGLDAGLPLAQAAARADGKA